MPKESPNIRRYLTCLKCHESKPVNQSMAEYARLNVGITTTGFEVWCTRHRMSVAHVSLETLEKWIEHPPGCGCGQNHDQDEMPPEPSH